MNKAIRTMVWVGLLVMGAASCAQNESNPTSQNQDSSTANNNTRAALSQSGVDVVEQHYGKKGEQQESFVSTLEDIQQMIGTKCDGDNQCKVIGVGSRPCGGFAKFLVYSTSDSDEKKLKTQVAIFNGKQKLSNSKKGMVGICQHLSPPKTYCSNKQCVGSLNGRASELK